MSDRIEQYLHFSLPASANEAGPGLSADPVTSHAVLRIPAVSSFTELIQVYGDTLGQERYFGNSLHAFQDCLNDSKSFWSIQPRRLDVLHNGLPALPSSHLEAYISILIQAVIRYRTHDQHNQQLDPERIRQELHQTFPSMSEAQVEFYILPIRTTDFRVFFPASSREVLQQVLDVRKQDIQRELNYWTSRGFVLPDDFTS